MNSSFAPANKGVPPDLIEAFVTAIDRTSLPPGWILGCPSSMLHGVDRNVLVAHADEVMATNLELEWQLGDIDLMTIQPVLEDLFGAESRRSSVVSRRRAIGRKEVVHEL